MLTISGSSSFSKANVVVRAAQPALVAELVKRDAAHRAGLLVELGQLLGRLPDGQLLGQHAAARLGAAAGSSSAGVRYCRACSSHRCSSCGLPPVNSVMWKVAGLSHFWHFMAIRLHRLAQAGSPTSAMPSRRKSARPLSQILHAGTNHSESQSRQWDSNSGLRSGLSMASDPRRRGASAVSAIAAADNTVRAAASYDRCCRCCHARRCKLALAIALTSGSLAFMQAVASAVRVGSRPRCAATAPAKLVPTRVPLSRLRDLPQAGQGRHAWCPSIAGWSATR